VKDEHPPLVGVGAVGVVIVGVGAATGAAIRQSPPAHAQPATLLHCLALDINEHCGPTTGDLVGKAVGETVGLRLGNAVGLVVGVLEIVGLTVGAFVGLLLGALDGLVVGALVGLLVGLTVGDDSLYTRTTATPGDTVVSIESTVMKTVCPELPKLAMVNDAPLPSFATRVD